MSRLTAIMSGKGGVGKTTLTAALGITLARMGKKVLLLDGDLGLCNLDLILGVSDRVRFNMYDMALGKCFSDEVIVPVETNLDFMAGSSEYTWDTVFEGAVDTVLEDMDGQYDYILLDCPAGLGRGITYAETHANDAIIVQVPTRSSERDAHRLKKELPGKIPVWFIGNEFVWNDEQFLSPSDFVRSVDVRDLLGIVPRTVKAGTLSNQGKFGTNSDWGIFGEAMRIVAKNYVHFRFYPQSTWNKLIQQARTEETPADSSVNKKKQQEKESLLARMVYKWGRRRW